MPVLECGHSSRRFALPLNHPTAERGWGLSKHCSFEYRDILVFPWTNVKRLIFFLPFLFTLACGPETMPRPKLDPSSRTKTPEPPPAPAEPAIEAAPVVPEAPPSTPEPEAPPAPAEPALTELCEDNFEAAINGLGEDAGLVLFVASEYDSSKKQVEQFKRFVTSADYTGIQFFKVEVNSCSKLMMSQKISRVPAISIYQNNRPLGTVSMLNNVLIEDSQIEDLIAEMN
ncbi:MAG: hypothetical protein ACI8RZ_005279 [Myxococcota bacterium]